MTFGLPAYDEPNWNTKLDDSILAVKTTADGAAQKASNLADLASAATARSNLGLGNVDNTSDASKPVSTATQTALNNRVSKWVASTAYALGDPVLAPDGSLVKAKAAHTSGASYTAANWTTVNIYTGTQAQTELAATFVAKVSGTATRADIQAAITAAGAASGVGTVRLAKGATYVLDATLTGLSDVVLDLNGATLQVAAGANVDAVTGTSLTNFHVIGGIIDGNGANQTGTALSGDDAAIPGRGVFLSGCTRSSVEKVKVTGARLHGVLVYGGTDNYAHDVETSDCGSLTNTRYGNGFYVWNSPNFRGDGLIARNNSANSGVVTVGGTAAANISLSNVLVEGGGASGISLNSSGARLDGFRVSTSPTGFAGLNIGHSSSSTYYCDNPTVSNGIIVDAAGWGMNVDGSLGLIASNVTISNTAHNSLRITGSRAGKARFANCVFDGVTVSDTTSRGQAVLITSAGGATAYGDVDFIGCHARNALRSGLHVVGASRVRWIGGTVEDNTGPGIVAADDGTLLCGEVVSIGTTFRDTRSGASRTQTYPIQVTGTGGKNVCLGYWSDNHLTSNVPQMTAATTDCHWGYQGQAGAMAPLLPTPGTAAAPGHAFQGRANQGMFSLGSNTVGFSASGTEQGRYDTTKWQFSIPIRPGVYTTAGRPSAATVGAGAMAYDTTLSKPIWSDGTAWRDAAGTAV